MTIRGNSMGYGTTLVIAVIVCVLLSVTVIPTFAGTGYTSQLGVIMKVQITTGCAVTVKYGVWFGVRYQAFTVSDAYMCKAAYVVSVGRRVYVYGYGSRKTGISLPKP